MIVIVGVVIGVIVGVIEGVGEGVALGVIVNVTAVMMGVGVPPPQATSCIASVKITNKNGIRSNILIAHYQINKQLLFLE